MLSFNYPLVYTFQRRLLYGWQFNVYASAFGRHFFHHGCKLVHVIAVKCLLQSDFQRDEL